jgi:hypothetical protein
MTHFSNPRSSRNTALMVLLVWLFAVASGIANTCVLKAHDAYPTVETVDAAHGVHASTGHKFAVADHGSDEVEVSKAPCLKVCNDGTQLLIKQQTSLDLGDPGSAFLVSVLWNAVKPVVTSPRQRDSLRATAHGPPIRVRFSRLAL